MQQRRRRIAISEIDYIGGRSLTLRLCLTVIQSLIPALASNVVTDKDLGYAQ